MELDRTDSSLNDSNPLLNESLAHLFVDIDDDDDDGNSYIQVSIRTAICTSGETEICTSNRVHH